MIPRPPGELGRRLDARSHPESFLSQARALASERGVTLEMVAMRTAMLANERGLPGASFSSATKHLSGTASGSPSLTLMSLAAEVLDVDPKLFAEYRLAMARAALDETVVGLDEALRALNDGGASCS